MHLYFNGPRSVFLLVESQLGIAFPAPEISYGSEFETTVRMNSVKFGDGYEQRSLDGINTMPLKLNFRFANRSLEVIQQIDAFLRGTLPYYDRTPDEYFYYIPPPPHDGIMQTPRKFKCESWKLGSDQYNNHTISGVFEEVFDP
jgi:phage-related protein